MSEFYEWNHRIYIDATANGSFCLQLAATKSKKNTHMYIMYRFRIKLQHIMFATDLQVRSLKSNGSTRAG